MKKSVKDNIIRFAAKKKSMSKGFPLYNEGLYFFTHDDDTKALKKFLQAEKDGYISAEMFASIAWLYGYPFEDKDKAFYYIRKTLDIDYEYGYAHFLYGNLYFDECQYNKALEHLLKAENFNYFNPTLYLDISKCYYLMEPSNYLKAMEYASKLLQNYPDFEEGYKWKGWLIYDKEEYAKALKYFNKAESFNIPSDDLYFFLSYCYDMIDDFENAVKYANKIIFMDKKDYSGYYRKAFIYFRREYFDKARENFLLAEKYACPHSDLYSRLAYTCIYGQNPDRELALKYVNKAQENNKKDFECFYVLGCMYMVLDKDYKNAVKYFKKYYKFEKNLSVEFYSNYGFSLLKMHRYKDSNNYINEGLNNFKDDKYLIQLKITVSTALKNYKEVYKYTQKLYKTDNTDTNAIFYKALYYFNIKDYKTCIKYCKKVSDDDIDKFAILGFCHFALKDYSKSNMFMEKFVRLKNSEDFLEENHKEFCKYYRSLKKKFPESPLIALIDEKFPDIIRRKT